MARQTTRRKGWIAAGLVVGLIALSAGAWALHRWRPFADDPVAVSWPDNVKPLADYVEQSSGLEFLHPVHIEFIADDAAYTERVSAPIERTDEDRAAATADEAMGRAFGFWDDSLKILDDATSIREANVDDVTWDPDTSSIVVHAKGESADLPVVDRATLVLMLASELDDQHYDVSARLDRLDDPQQFQALAALDIGQAIWVRDQYIADLTGDDADAYAEAESSGSQDYVDDVSDISLAFRSLRVAAQNVGVPFVKALHESRDHDAVARAFQGDTPVAIDQLSLPVSKYERRDHPEPVEAPPTPTGGRFIQDRQLGPFGLYMLLAAGLPAPEALVASDGWGNDAVTVYELDGRTCVDARIVADSRTDADRIERGLNAWGAQRPGESGVLVGRDDTTLLVSACDPGDVDQPIVGREQIDQWFTRADALGQAVDFIGLPDVAECAVVRFFEEHTAADFAGDNADFDPVDELDTLTSDCAQSR